MSVPPQPYLKLGQGFGRKVRISAREIAKLQKQREKFMSTARNLFSFFPTFGESASSIITKTVSLSRFVQYFPFLSLKPD